jgi:hypothetical protein
MQPKKAHSRAGLFCQLSIAERGIEGGGAAAASCPSFLTCRAGFVQIEDEDAVAEHRPFEGEGFFGGDVVVFAEIGGRDDAAVVGAAGAPLFVPEQVGVVAAHRRTPEADHAAALVIHQRDAVRIAECGYGVLI